MQKFSIISTWFYLTIVLLFFFLSVFLLFAIAITVAAIALSSKLIFPKGENNFVEIEPH